MTSVKKLCICALCIALCAILPLVLHPFGNELATALSPMHFPVFLCGLVCGWGYGGACGLTGPLLSLLISKRPVPPRLIFMMAELFTYGVVVGLLFRRIRTGRTLPDLYLAMLPAMILGRIVGGLVQAAVMLGGGDGYSLSLWAGTYLLGTLPGLIAQLVIVPVLYLTLTNAGLIPARYKKDGTVT